MIKLLNKKSIFKIFSFLTICLLSVFSFYFQINKNVESEISYAVETESVTSQFLKSVLELDDRPDVSYSVRDEFKIDPENQQSQEFCWLFSSLKSLEISYMKQRKEFYNFSETALAYFNYLVNLEQQGDLATYNAMGNIDKFNYVVSKYGLVFENDVSNDILGKITESNYEKFNYILEKTNKDLYSNVEIVSFDGNSYFRSQSYNNQITIMQNFIKNYGALYLSLDENGVLYNSGNGMAFYSINVDDYKFTGTPISKHAVCLIGWNQTGFIALNSNGFGNKNFETFCIPYDSNESKLDKILNTQHYGSEEDNNRDNVKGFVIKNSNNVNMDNLQNGKILKNVFQTADEVHLSYSINNFYNLNNMTVSIFRGTEDVTFNFDIRFNESGSKIVIESGNTVEAGGYVVEFYSKNEQIAKSSFFISSGSEVLSVLLQNKQGENYITESVSQNLNYLTSLSTATYLINSYDEYYLKLFLSNYSLGNNLEEQFNDYENKNNLFEISKIKVKKIVNDEEVWVETNLSILKDNIDYNLNNFMFKLPNFSTSYYNKYISFDININSTIVGGEDTKLTFIFFISNIDGANTSQNFNIVYNLNGGKNSELNITNFPNYANYSLMYEFVLQNPMKQGYTFVGWYEDEQLRKQVFKISKSNLKDVVLYAKWDSVGVENYLSATITMVSVYDYLNNDKQDYDFIEYGDSAKFNFSFRTHTELNGYNYSARISAFYIVGNKTVYIDDFNSINIYSAFSQDFDINFPELVAGEYKIVFRINVLINGVAAVETEEIYNFVVNKKVIRVDFENLSFVYDGELKLPNPKSFSGYVYNEDIDKFGLSYSIFPQKTAGIYDFLITSNNKNYEVCEECKQFQFEILKKELIIDFEETDFVYNAKKQVPDFVINGIVAGDYVTINYVNDNFETVGEYTAIINKDSISNNNYFVKDYSVNFKIVPATIKITLKDVYEALIISPEYRKQVDYDIEGNIFESISEEKRQQIINSLNLKINTAGLTTNKYGDYKISANIENENFIATIIDAVYYLSGNYKVFYELPNGEFYEENITEGETPKGITRDVYPHTIFQKIEYSNPLEGDGTANVFIRVTVKDYTFYVVAAVVIVAFVVVYLIMTRKQRRNKVS